MQTLSAAEISEVQELVKWGAKVTQVAGFFPASAIEAVKYAQKCYKQLKVRPPSGVPGGATSEVLKTIVKMQYAALANQFLMSMDRGMSSRDAQIHVLRAHYQDEHIRTLEPIRTAVWFDVAKSLLSGACVVTECQSCGGHNIQNLVKVKKSEPVCLWCGHSHEHQQSTSYLAKNMTCQKVGESIPQMLTGSEINQIQEMVLWGLRIKQITKFFIHAPVEAEKRAKHCYKILGISPPRGQLGIVHSTKLKLTVRMQYAAMSNQYKICVERGMDTLQAQLLVFRLHWNEFRALPPESRVKGSVWIDTVNHSLMVDYARYRPCGSCGGMHIRVKDEPINLSAKCMWCSASLPIGNFNDIPKFVAPKLRELKNA